ncbi:MAG: tetratricopeptide repeat protein [Pirellulales bacterium]
MSAPSDTFQLAFEHHAAGRTAEAARLYADVVRANPRHAHAWHQLGCLALAQGRADLAKDYFVNAVRISGREPTFHNNLGECFRNLGMLAEAEASFRQAVRLDAHYVAPRVNLSWTLLAQSRSGEFDASAREALAMPRSSAEEHCACAALRLVRGDLPGGWEEHEWRLDLPGVARPSLPGARWDGQPLAGQRVLIAAEQGLGDTLQFVRYLPQVAERGGQPVLWAPQCLLELLRDSLPCAVTPREEPPPPCDLHASLLSLPHLFATTLDTIPNRVPYLRADEKLVTQWGDRLTAVAGYRVGICWHGNPLHPRDRLRSIPAGEFAALGRVSGVRLISLQKGTPSEQLPALAAACPVVDLQPEYDVESGAFLNAAAIMRHLDLVVTADTAIAHLAGALGVPVWTALPIAPDWRWLLARDDSPWYPSMRMFRQTRSGDWPEVFSRLATELAARASR